MTPDDVEAFVIENIRLGYMEFAGIDPDGDFRYRLTEAGERRAEELLGMNDE